MTIFDVRTLGYALLESLANGNTVLLPCGTRRFMMGSTSQLEDADAVGHLVDRLKDKALTPDEDKRAKINKDSVKRWFNGKGRTIALIHMAVQQAAQAAHADAPEPEMQAPAAASTIGSSAAAGSASVSRKRKAPPAAPASAVAASSAQQMEEPEPAAAAKSQKRSKHE